MPLTETNEARRQALVTRPSKNNTFRARHTVVHLQTRPDLVRDEVLDGREYLVAPVVPLTEGVHNGEFISYDEITVFPEAWDGIPLPIDHPQDGDGFAITANSPEIIASSVVGVLFNVTADEGINGIRGELWIDKEKAQTIPGGQESMDRILNGEQLEVSTAYFTFLDQIPGEYEMPDGEVRKFSSSQFGVRPDHLALLPFDTGACSWEDGCGAPRINISSDNENPDSASSASADDHDVEFSSSLDSGSSTDMANQKLQVNGVQLGRSLEAAIATHAVEGDSSNISNRLSVAAGIDIATFNSLVAGELDFVPRTWLNIFAAVLDIDPWDLYMASGNDNVDTRHASNGADADDEGKQATNTGSDTPCGCQKKADNADAEDADVPAVVAADADTSPEGKGIKVRVREAIYEVLESIGLQKNSEDTSMTKEQRVEALIASNRFSEDHRETLLSMNEEQLAVIELPEVETAVEEVSDDTATVAQETAEVTEVVEDTATEAVETAEAAGAHLSKEAVLEVLGISEADLASIQGATAARNSARDEKIRKLSENSDCPYSDEELRAMPEAALDKTVRLFSEDDSVPYRVGASIASNADEDEVPVAPAIIAAPRNKEGN